MASPEGQALLASAAARLSHEIRNSLAGIAGALDVLRDRVTDDPDIDDVFGRVRREVARIESSVAELSHFAEATQPVLKRKNLHEVIDRVLSRTPLGATTKVKRDYGIDVRTVRVDEKLLGEALRRVFLNALDAMPSGGTLSVTTSCASGRVVITVRDTGPGIHEERLGAIFEPFYSGKSRGLGLGLAITRRCVEAHGGSISAASTPGAEGTELTIVLPGDP